jgi:hypothetical protein
MRMSDRAVENVFLRLRWPPDGKLVCPGCRCMICYAYPRSASQPRWRCNACRSDFSITSGTLFAWHKLREAMASRTKALRIGGEGRVAEIDGAYFGGHVRPQNRTADRLDRRLAENRSGKRQVVVVMRERAGRTLVQVAPAEAATVPTIRQRVAKGTLLHADESTAWNTLHAGFAMRRINIRTDTASTAPAPITQSPISRVCAAANSAITTISPGRILSATPRKAPGARTCAASATASRCMASSAWRCGTARRSTSVAIGNGPRPPRSAAN